MLNNSLYNSNNLQDSFKNHPCKRISCNKNNCVQAKIHTSYQGNTDFIRNLSDVLARIYYTAGTLDNFVSDKSELVTKKKTNKKLLKCICDENAKNQTSQPGLIEEFNREADDFIICDNSLFLICHLSTILV